MKKIKLKNDVFALADDDTEIPEKWHLDSGGYVIRLTSRNDLNDSGRRKIIFLHRLIMNAKNGEIVDHINGDKLDNRRSNLRIVNKSQNAINSKIRIDNKSGFKGVYFDKRNKKWCAEIRLNKKKKFLGYFSNVLNAAEKYKKASLLLHGEFSCFNK